MESGLFSADDTSSSSEEDYFNLSDPEATAENICFTCHKVSIPIDTMSNSILPSASPSPSRAHPSARSFLFFIKVIILFMIFNKVYPESYLQEQSHIRYLHQSISED